jgi:hypothetical protein
VLYASGGTATGHIADLLMATFRAFVTTASTHKLPTLIVLAHIIARLRLCSSCRNATIKETIVILARSKSVFEKSKVGDSEAVGASARNVV